MRRVGPGVSLQPYYDECGTTSSKDFERLKKTTDRKLAIMRDGSKRGKETNRDKTIGGEITTIRRAEVRPLVQPRFPQGGGSGD